MLRKGTPPPPTLNSYDPQISTEKGGEEGLHPSTAVRGGRDELRPPRKDKRSLKAEQ